MQKNDGKGPTARVSTADHDMMGNMLPAQPNQSIIDALECLEAVVSAAEPVGVRDLARRLDMNRAKVNRILMTLAHCDFLQRTDKGHYRPGNGIHALAALATEGSSLQRIAIRHLHPWWQEGYSVTLGVRWHEFICYIIRARAERPFEEGIGGRRGPVLESSAGLFLIAALSDSQIQNIPLNTQGLEHIRNMSFHELIAATRKNGYALIHFQDGTESLGVGIGEDPVAAVAVSRKRVSVSDRSSLLAKLRVTARNIAMELKENKQ